MTIATVVTTTRHWWRVQLRKWTKHEQLLENGATEANGKGRELLSVGGWGCDCDLWWILASPMHWAAYHVSKWYYFLIEENFFFGWIPPLVLNMALHGLQLWHCPLMEQSFWMWHFHALLSFYHHKLLALGPTWKQSLMGRWMPLQCC